MLAVVLNEIKTPLEVVRDHADAAAHGRGDEGVVIDVTACGVCHSDIHVVDGDFGSNLPLILGHEVTGVHPQLGPVMVYAPWGCGKCAQCEAGLENMCPQGCEAGLFTDGGYAERMWVKNPAYLAQLGDLDPIAAAPLACGGLTAYRAVKHGVATLHERGPAGRALVIGGGGLGQYATRYLKLLTDAKVIVMDRATDKQAIARQIGADEAVGPDDDVAACDVVLDFIGIDATLDYAASHLARRGVLIVVGLGGGRIPFGFGAFPHEARLMTSVWGSRAELDELLDFARREPAIVQPVEQMPLSQAQLAHDRLRSGDVRGRIVLIPDPTR